MDIRENRLNNGLNIITIKKDTRFASIRIGVKVGSMDEKVGQEGISHFVEHLIFQQTRNRTNKMLLKDLALYGGDYNGMTYKDKTIYMYDVLSEDLDKALEISSDMITNSLMDISDIERERTVIISELNLYSQELPECSRDSAFGYAFPNKGLSIPEGGYVDSVVNITEENIKNHYKTYYVPENAGIVIVSPYEHEYVLGLINKHFSSWENSNLPRNERIETIVTKNIEINHKMENKTQEVVYYIFSAQNLNEKESVLLDLAVGRLGFGMSCLLWKRLRSELGIAYDTRAYLTQYGNTSVIECYGVVASDDFELAKRAIKDSLNDLSNIRVLEEGLINTKKEYIYENLSLMESNSRLSEYYISEILNNEDISSIKNRLNIIENATATDVLDVINKYMVNPCIVYSKDK